MGILQFVCHFVGKEDHRMNDGVSAVFPDLLNRSKRKNCRKNAGSKCN